MDFCKNSFTNSLKIVPLPLLRAPCPALAAGFRNRRKASRGTICKEFANEF